METHPDTANTNYSTAEFLPDSSLLATRYIVQNILVPIVSISGVVGNVLSIIVLTHQSMKSSTNCYLTALSVADTLYIIFSATLSFKHYNHVGETVAYTYWSPVATVLADMSSNVSVWLTVTLTIERYIVIRHPMNGRNVCSIHRAESIIALISVIVIALTVPEFFEREVVDSMDKSNRTTLIVRYTDFSRNVHYAIGYYWFWVLSFTIVPLVVLCMLNTFLIYSIVQSTSVRRHLVATSKRYIRHDRHLGEQKITIMLVAVVVVFIICQTPGAILLLYTIYLGDDVIAGDYRLRRDVLIAGNVVNLLIQVNAAVNFILYCILSAGFRRTWKRLFCRCLYSSIRKSLPNKPKNGEPPLRNNMVCQLHQRHDRMVIRQLILQHENPYGEENKNELCEIKEGINSAITKL